MWQANVKKQEPNNGSGMGMNIKLPHPLRITTLSSNMRTITEISLMLLLQTRGLGSKIFSTFIGFLKSKDLSDGTEQALLDELTISDNISLD
ncbi:hypothetical protein RD792_011547 [Penstemon davidsonii]|uniref:Uncharacterized protein n=1 Tax=Penstemon davidsonii TaxID=160366 RepID=A0ABR0CZW3_9LAMI|nr:hypothetical protein RD792_011547 [Penstemon davidsonii]